ncbi:MAG: putative AlkP superfamily phosphohydrolase/phosphomutase/tetratricopeptide (TPR) repeat protein [Akkermansiaceae bacterium]|jgi:predicted AlkP superfamily phosphohydrolase/phosphomutase/tetratricopeptide (TPR) repeat protein
MSQSNATKKPHQKKVLLIGWDSADWKIINALLEEGGMDGIRSLMDGGTHGNLTTLEPQLSPMLWTSIVTGKMAYHHGVEGFTEVDPVSGKIVPVSATTRKCKTVWEMLGEHGKRSHVVSWFATQGEQDLDGKMVSNIFGYLKGTTQDMDPADFPPPLPGTYWPEDLAGTMNEMRVSPHEIDEDILQPFLPAGHKIDQSRDKRLNNLREHLAEAYSVHSAATHVMESDPEWDFMAVYYRAIDEISHHFMHYHPPQMAGIPDDDFEIYQHVVKATYRAHDMMLQRLLQLAGPNTTVILVSDHGFHSDHLRPKFTPRVPAGITVWHRNQGVLLAKGPGIKPVSEIYGARLLDIAPTVLHAFGLPVGDDMEGRVLTELFEETQPVQTIPTWENPDGKKQNRSSLTEEDSQTLLEHFVALGYIDEISDDPTEAAEETNRENKWNLARAYLYTGKNDGALPLLEDCFNAYPERTDYAQALAKTQLALGLAAEAEETLEICLETLGPSVSAHLLQGDIEVEKGNYQKALEHLEIILEQAGDEVPVLELSCRNYVFHKRWEEARATAQKLLTIDPTSIQAHNTLTRCHLHARDPEAAVDTALVAIGYQFANPRGHYLLGQALIQLEQWPEAEHALKNCLQLDRESVPTLSALKQVYQATKQSDKAEALEADLVRQKVINTTAREKDLQSLRHGIAARAKDRHAERQKKREAAAKKAAEEAAIEPCQFTIVSGLPRSGTSLMMQMLRAAGMDLMHDGKRAANEDNLEGYWEWEKIKTLKKNPRLIEQAGGKVIKIISALLSQLPPRHKYRIIFMKRPVEEVVDSQWKMLERSGQSPVSEKQHLIQTQETHVEQTLAQLRQLQDVQLIEIDYPEMVSDPDSQLDSLKAFLGKATPKPDQLVTAIRPELHRNKAKTAATAYSP